MAARLSAHFGSDRVSVASRLPLAMDNADGVVNTTPVGMAKLPGIPLDPALLRPECWVADIVYFPLETELLAQARRRGCRTLSGEGRAPGLVAYRDGEPVGWVSLGPRDDYERLTHSKVLAPIDDRPVWSIVCFVVARKARKQGIANALLDAAVAYAREHGATLLEAYPADTHGGRISAGSAYKGTLSMFERAGFEVAARRRANRASAERPIVRRRLGST